MLRSLTKVWQVHTPNGVLSIFSKSFALAVKWRRVLKALYFPSPLQDFFPASTTSFSWRLVARRTSFAGCPSAAIGLMIFRLSVTGLMRMELLTCGYLCLQVINHLTWFASFCNGTVLWLPPYDGSRGLSHCCAPSTKIYLKAYSSFICRNLRTLIQTSLATWTATSSTARKCDLYR